MPSAGAGSPPFADTLSGRSLRLPRARRPTRGREVVSEAVTRQRGDPARARRPHESIPFEHPSRFRTLRECRFDRCGLETSTLVLRVFVAGASGVIGVRLVPQLVVAGHEVAGMTRSPAKVELLRGLGGRAGCL